MPTAENFAIPEIERGLMVGFGPMFIYSKGEDYFSYLIEVEPGTYNYYGPVFLAANGHTLAEVEEVVTGTRTADDAYDSYLRVKEGQRPDNE